MSGSVKVYRQARKGRQSPHFFCAACCDPYFAAGKFHAPIVVPVDDLGDKRCIACDAPLVPATTNPEKPR